MKRLVLVGGGHAHLSVLEALARTPPAGVETVLVTPSPFQIYSGMLPGWMAGHYDRTQCQIELPPLARAAGVRSVTDRVVGMDAKLKFVQLSDGRQLEYNLLSLDVGSEINTSSLHLAGDKLLPVKPLDVFFDAWPRILFEARNKAPYLLVVVGGGAAGVELALASKYAFSGQGRDARVELVAAESGLLAGHSAGVQRRVSRYLATAGVVVHRQQGAGTHTGVALSDGTLLRADCVIAATGARAPDWIARTGLALDRDGYIAVDGCYRSNSHPDVFAVGDVSARRDVAVARSGVHAVHAGPVLAGNLMAVLGGGKTRAYLPHRHSLYLLACGPRYAIASWGRFSAQGTWVWHWKDHIDRGFVRRFQIKSKS